MSMLRLFSAIITFMAVGTSTAFGLEGNAPTFAKIQAAWRNLLDTPKDYSMIVESSVDGAPSFTEHIIRKGPAGALITLDPNQNSLFLNLLNEKYAALAMNERRDFKELPGELRSDSWKLLKIATRSPETDGDKLNAKVEGLVGAIPYRNPWLSHRHIGLLEKNLDSHSIELQQGGGARVYIEQNTTDDPLWKHVRSADMALEGAPYYLLKQLNITEQDGRQINTTYSYTIIDGIPYLAGATDKIKTPDGREVEATVNYKYLPVASLDDSIFKLSNYGLEEPVSAPPEPRNELGRGALVSLLLIVVIVAVMFYRRNRKKIA